MQVILGRLPFTPSIRVEILRVNIQCCSLSKRKMEKSQNVPVSIGKFKKKRKNVLIKLVAYNFLNVSSGMVCTISISNQNFWVFRVNGKRPWTILSPARVEPLYGAGRKESSGTGLDAESDSVRMAIHFFVNFDIFKWLYLSQN